VHEVKGYLKLDK